MIDARITDDTRTISLAIEGAPDMTMPSRPGITIAPRSMEITYRWRETAGLYFTGVDMSGPRRLKNGSLGQSTSSAGYLSPDQRPDWVNDLVDQHTPADWPEPTN